ncbi:MAG TPA: ABC transporter permease, partial [Gemmatimonadaceae bacterium]|nr:ABC transporter permease [Gemmatimonadaceae bacterium]
MIRVYRALLRLYPASFRAEYEDELTTVFAARMRERSGPLAPLVNLLAAIGDVVPSAVAAHWDVLRQDLAYTARALRRAPGFAATVVLVAALGVGANTAAFSLADFVLVRPLPFREPDRLVYLWQRTPGYSQMELSPPNYRDWKDGATSFEAFGAYTNGAANLVDAGDPVRVQLTRVTPEIIPLLGIRPYIGRGLVGADSAATEVVLGYGLWQTQFGGDHGVLGRAIRLDGTPFTVVGVMPPSFHFPARDVALWVPLELRPGDDNDDRTNNYLYGLARLRAGVSLEEAQAEMSVIAARLERQYPKENRETGAAVIRLRDWVSERARLLVLALCGAALCILLLACANLASLLLARAVARRRELAVRAALGAGRERLVRQLMTESVALALLGGLVGVGVAVAGVPLLARLVPSTLPIAEYPAVDARILLFAAGIVLVTGMIFGVAPALRAGRSSALDALRDGARAGGGRTQRLRALMVGIEVAASVVLLISSGLLMRAVWRIQGVDPGFRGEGVFAVQTALPLPRYAVVAAREQFYRRVLDEVRSLPGVESAAYVSGLPMVMRGGIWPVGLADADPVRDDENSASLRYATPRLFATLGVPLLRGRDLAETDAQDRPYVAVVSESFARRYWPDEDPVGKRFTFAFNERTVVGVVGDVRVRGLERPSEPQVYLSSQQVADSSISYYAPKELVVRASAPVGPLVPAVRRIVKAADPDQPVSDVRTMAQVVGDETAPRRVQ